MKAEERNMFLAVSEAFQSLNEVSISESGIISIVSAYAVGIIVPCSKCDAEISISSRFDVDNTMCNVDSDGKSIMVNVSRTFTYNIDSNPVSDNSDDADSQHVDVYG